ncbi:MAG: NUDIX domain-containing protein [bacterium]|nr:NUDIX domain-containing protein [bacterium]
MKKGIDYIGVAVGVTLFNEKGQIFLSKRGQEVKNEKGTWEGPGGSIDFGERMADAIRREMREEYDIEIEIIKKFPAEDHFIPAEKQHWVATTFWATLKAGQEPKIMEPHKCDAIGWFDLENLPEPLSIITQIDLKKVKDHRNLLELIPSDM